MTTCPPSARRPTRECHPRAAWVALCRVAQASIQGAMRARAVDLCQSSCVCVCVYVWVCVRRCLSVCVRSCAQLAGNLQQPAEHGLLHSHLRSPRQP
jgi:hypothetical protein